MARPSSIVPTWTTSIGTVFFGCVTLIETCMVEGMMSTSSRSPFSSYAAKGASVSKSLVTPLTSISAFT